VTLVAIESKRARKSRGGRKEELDDLISAFDRLVHHEHPNPNASAVQDRPLSRGWRES